MVEEGRRRLNLRWEKAARTLIQVIQVLARTMTLISLRPVLFLCSFFASGFDKPDWFEKERM
jgi:hypothetical protein